MFAMLLQSLFGICCQINFCTLGIIKLGKSILVLKEIFYLMKKYFLTAICLIFATVVIGQNFKQEFISKDIENFWEAYDKIISTKDTILQQKYLKELYLDKGTEGLKSLVNVRGYTEKDFLDNINNSPKFWNSIRENTLSLDNLYSEILSDIQKFKTYYPTLKTIPIYFSIGAFRTNGTVHENKILIGSEYSLVDEKTVILDDLPEERHSFYKTFQPRKNIALLSIHEYVHTQQNELVHNLLSYCLYEGIAEFISCKVTEKESNSPALQFGETNQCKVVTQFVKDLFIGDNIYNWLWGNNKNHLKARDLGYYVGYEIAKRYYNQSADKKQAIKDLIELDYTNNSEVERIVDGTNFLPKTLAELYSDYEKMRPRIVSIEPFKNGSQNVDFKTSQIILEFSEAMDECCRGFDFGDLGESHAVRIKNIIGWSDNRKHLIVEIHELKPKWKYQLTITSNFKSLKGNKLKTYLIEFKTRAK